MLLQRWLGEPATTGTHGGDEAGGLELGAGPSTDWFCDPRGSAPVASAPVAVLVDRMTPVVVRCRVEVELGATFDAAGLLAHYDDTHWVKFAVELDPQGRARIVTVRTDGWSDDANHLVLEAPASELRLAVDEHSLALHARPGSSGPWELIRYAAHPAPAPPAIGALVQSPTGEGTTARFGAITIEQRRLDELRDGT